MQKAKKLAGTAGALAPLAWYVYKTCRRCDLDPRIPLAGLGLGLLFEYLRVG